ncbi:Potassium transporter 5 [Camellia lanceoleosa]|uniref:Potassium transporter 5 n=1 Tax=Camellia lanceoleosa TaxID=1840588 RepID=A0ACC0F6Z1_9ERIC|nr:Potassium transporter 5 [Camellia lanceoleosa]
MSSGDRIVDAPEVSLVEVSDQHHQQQEQQIKGRKLSHKKLRRYDSLDVESTKLHSHHAHPSVRWGVVLHLAFQSIGVVYGDIGTSPLYVYASTLSSGINHNDDILGVLSLIIYTLTLIPLFKYVLVVLRANDNGNAQVGLVPSQEAEDRDVSTFSLELPNPPPNPNNRVLSAARLKSKLEKSIFAKSFLLFATMLGTSMVIGDGILTPCISVLTAVGGIKEATPSMTEACFECTIVGISIGILVCLFMVQRLGTDKVGYSFAPIICVWFLFIAGIGVYNFIKFDPTVVKALNPLYIIHYFKRNKKDAWISLGGIVLCITGTEAMFADVGHFSVGSIQISMCAVTYPALILAYTGQALSLGSTISPMYWPMFVVAVLAAIIASQAMISGTFSIVQQSLSLGCFPRVKIIHTSAKFEGQVYIPEINYLLMLACVVVTAVCRDCCGVSDGAYISIPSILIMILIWKTHMLLVMLYVVVVGTIELLYLSSVLYKFDQGGYLPLAFAFFIMVITYIWNDVYRRKYYYELDHKICPEKLKEIVGSGDDDQTKFCRNPGLAIFYSELVHGIPPIFKHYVENVPALHTVLVFVSIKSLPISKVPVEERFLFRRVQPKELNVFRCVVRYGYTDVRNKEHDQPFETILVERLKEFITRDYLFSAIINICNESGADDGGSVVNGGGDKIVNKDMDDGDEKQVEKEEKHGVEGVEEAILREIGVVDKAWRGGVVHFLCENEVVAGEGSGIGKRILINYAYSFIRRNLRQADKVFDIPHKRLLKVGMTYEL